MVEGPGIVHENVQAAEIFDHLVDHGFHLFAIGHVHLQGDGAPPHVANLAGRLFGVDRFLGGHDLGERALRGLGHLLELRVTFDQNVGDHHVGAGPRQRQAVGPAQAPRAARHQGHLPLEVDHG